MSLRRPKFRIHIDDQIKIEAKMISKVSRQNGTYTYIHRSQELSMDWSECPLVEINPRKVSGVPIVKGTRMQADSIVENYENGSPIEEIADNFEIPADTIRQVLEYAHARQKVAVNL